MGVLPFLSLLLLFLTIILYSSKEKHYKDWRHVLIISTILWGTYITIINELLNLFHLITRQIILAVWFTTIAILLILVIYLTRKNNFRWGYYIHSNIQMLSEFKITFYTVLIFGLALLMVGIVFPPDNYDSFSYHLSRVEHWIQNKSISPYLTNIIRQNTFNPWAEYAILHIRILSTNDYLVNILQWYSWFFCIITTSSIAKLLDAKPKVQMWTALIAGTIPMGLLQATTTQNDFVVSMWLTALVYILLYTIRYKAVTALSILTGMGLGLAILTKGTGYIFSAPFLVFFIIFSNYKIYTRAVVQYVIVGIVALCLNLGYFARNLYTYNELISGSGGVDDVRIHNINLQNTVSNMTRNIGLHITVPNQDATNTLQQSIFAIHRRLGIDINNPDTTFGGTYFVHQLKLHEDLEGNPFHLIMIITAIIVWLRNKKTPLFNLYAISLFSTFILFSALFKWQVSGSRLQLPFFILSSPFTSISLEKLRNSALEKPLSIILILISCFYVFYTRPYRIEKRTHDISTITRDYLYVYRLTPEVRKSFLRLKREIETTQCENFGLLVAGDDPEYPIWALTRQYSQQHNIKYEHILINDSGLLVYDNHKVICMLLVSDNVMNILNADLSRKKIVLSNYQLTWQSPFWYIYTPAE